MDIWMEPENNLAGTYIVLAHAQNIWKCSQIKTISSNGRVKKVQKPLSEEVYTEMGHGVYPLYWKMYAPLFIVKSYGSGEIQIKIITCSLRP